ncbi:unnamed protein product, partial [Chrysoparadoxa australica]
MTQVAASTGDLFSATGAKSNGEPKHEPRSAEPKAKPARAKAVHFSSVFREQEEDDETDRGITIMNPMRAALAKQATGTPSKQHQNGTHEMAPAEMAEKKVEVEPRVKAGVSAEARELEPADMLNAAESASAIHETEVIGAGTERVEMVGVEPDSMEGQVLEEASANTEAREPEPVDLLGAVESAPAIQETEVIGAEAEAEAEADSYADAESEAVIHVASVPELAHVTTVDISSIFLEQEEDDDTDTGITIVNPMRTALATQTRDTPSKQHQIGSKIEETEESTEVEQEVESESRAPTDTSEYMP